MTNTKRMTFNEFCYKIADNLYEPRLPYYAQSTGYKELKNMVINNISPASLDDIRRWESTPSDDELISTPDIKYLRFLHPLLRPLIIENWDIIKTLEIS